MDRETGSSHGCLALAGGAQCWGGRVTGRFGAARPSKAPSISYMEGALLHSARHDGFCRGDTLANVAVPRDCRSWPRSIPRGGAGGR
jgi:hypothetical protein